MPSDQERIKVRGKVSAIYVNERCQWQGGSQLPCSRVVHFVAVKADFPIRFESNVTVCDAHRDAYVAEARKTGHLA